MGAYVKVIISLDLIFGILRCIDYKTILAADKQKQAFRIRVPEALDR
jgi:hypothetical protein